MPQLDGLRAAAVALVAFSHWVPEKYHFGLPLGDAGVQLFFVLSGFLITGILLRCRKHNDPKFAMRAFYARRFLRIFPLFYFVLLLFFVLDVVPVRETIFWHIPYLSNFYFISHGGWDGPISHFWSLAVEEQFYLFWPAVLLFVPDSWLSKSVVLLIAIGIASRFVLPIIFPAVQLLDVLPNSNFDALGLGALLALLRRGIVSRPISSFLVAGIPVYMVLFGLRHFDVVLPFHLALEHLAMIVGFAWLIAAASKGFSGFIGVLLVLPPLVYLGKISYGLYVLHNFASVPVQFLVEMTGNSSLGLGICRICLMAVFTIAGASLTWYAFEYPLNRLKRFFPYGKQGSNL